MSEDTASTRRVTGVEEHAWTPEPRRAFLRWGGDATVNKMSSRGEANLPPARRRRGTPGPHKRQRRGHGGPVHRAHGRPTTYWGALPPGPFRGFRHAVHVRKSSERSPAWDIGAMLFPRTGDTFLDHASFERVVEAAAHLGLPLYIHAAHAVPKARRCRLQRLRRDARPLRRPCRSAQHRCPAPAARLPGLHHRQPGRHRRRPLQPPDAQRGRGRAWPR